LPVWRLSEIDTRGDARTSHLPEGMFPPCSGPRPVGPVWGGVTRKLELTNEIDETRTKSHYRYRGRTTVEPCDLWRELGIITPMRLGGSQPALERVRVCAVLPKMVQRIRLESIAGRNDPLNLSISLSGGRESNHDCPSNGE